MGLGYNYTSSVPFCDEDNNSILWFEEMVDEEEKAHDCTFKKEKLDLCECFFKDFPKQSDECFGLILEKEVEFLPRCDYVNRLISGALDLSIRRYAVDWIWKVHGHYKFGPLTAYLSVNYLDRFLSTHEIPQGKVWMIQLLAVACLSLAAKMEETEVPLSLDLQVGDAKYVFESKTIQRMELVLLSTLKWRMHAVTPFSFIDYFLTKFNYGDLPTKFLLVRSTQLILNTVKGVEFLGFKPSVVASAVALSTLGETQAINMDKAIAFCNYVNKERVVRCYETIQEVILMKYDDMKDADRAQIYDDPQSPSRVLDVSCLSYKSDDTTIDTHDDSLHKCPPSKRRKLSKPLL